MAAFLRKTFNLVFNQPEEELNSDSFTTFPRFLFGLIFFRFNPLSESANLKTKIEYYGRSFFTSFCFLCFATLMVQMLVYLVLNLDDFDAFANGIPDIAVVLLCNLKGLSTVLQKNEIWDIFEELREICADRARENLTHRIKKYLDDYLRIIKVYAGLLVSMLIQTFYPWLLYLFDGSMYLVTNIWFPFDAFQNGIFPFALCWSNWNSFIFIVFYLASDTLFYALVTAITMEFDILKKDLNNLGFVSKEERNRSIKNLVGRHNKLLELSDKLQQVYSLTFLSIFLVSSLVMCFVAFRLSTSELNLENVSFLVLYFFMVSGQTFLLCIFGQKLIDSSSAVGDGLYNSDWIESKDHSFKKDIVLIILRSQRAKEFSAMKFACVSIESFTTVKYFPMNYLEVDLTMLSFFH